MERGWAVDPEPFTWPTEFDSQAIHHLNTMQYEWQLIMNLGQAIAIAAQAHEGQVDKAGKAHILHPIEVMLRVGDDVDMQIVAILHDTIEDTHVTSDTLYRAGFSHDIIMAVEAISKREGETNMDYWKRVRENELAKAVKLHDIAHNTSPSRMANLAEDERNYLQKKYKKALRVLNENDLSGETTKD